MNKAALFVVVGLLAGALLAWFSAGERGLHRRPSIPQLGPSLDHLEFRVPPHRDCPDADGWHASPTAFESGAYPVGYGLLHNVCACVLGNGTSNAHIGWSRLASGASAWEVSLPKIQLPNAGEEFRPPYNAGVCAGRASRQHVHGTIVASHDWKSHVSMQAECMLPMAQLVRSSTVARATYLQVQVQAQVPAAGAAENAAFVPYMRGTWAALGRPLEIRSVGADEAVCFGSVAVCLPGRKGWHSLRQSQLVPQRSGSLSVPSASAARHLAARARAHCGLPADSPLRAGAPLRTVRLLLRNVTVRKGVRLFVRTLRNVADVIRVLERHMAVGARVELRYIQSLDYCTQLRWVSDADLVLSAHGSHLASTAVMRSGAHLIEVQPYLYEQDANNQGCAPRRRHLLIGMPHARGRMPRQCHGLTAQQAVEQAACRFRIRDLPIRVPLHELDRLMRRIVAGRTSKGRFRCDPFRCAYR